MPRFTGQNKKKINPRYFLNETSQEWVDDELNRGWSDYMEGRGRDPEGSDWYHEGYDEGTDQGRDPNKEKEIARQAAMTGMGQAGVDW